jgi:hypothetical protein
VSLPILAGLLGIVVIVLALQDAFEAMLLPRRIQRRLQFMNLYFRLTWFGWKRVMRTIFGNPPPESVLSLFGPLSMLGLFALWAAGLIIGFGLLDWALQAGGPKPVHFFNDFYLSGATFFTLGYGDIVPQTDASRFIAVLEAGTGLGFIAMVIGYLPVLYQLFARREAHIIQLDGRAGSPPTAVALLCRHADGNGLANLDLLLRDWEVWGAELLESHLTYPMLAYYRSQHDCQSWLAALTAILDCSALILVGVTEMPPLQARMTFSMARQVVVELSSSFGLRPSHVPDDRMGEQGLQRMETAFALAGLAWESGQEGYGALQALRETYEPLLRGLSEHLLLVLPGWLPTGANADHWGKGHRGLLAQRLVEQLAERNPRAGNDRHRRRVALWRIIRRRPRN